MSYVLTHAGAALAAALVLYLAGLVLERALCARCALGELRHTARWLLGFVGWVVAAFVLASTGLLARGPLLALAFGVSAAGIAMCVPAALLRFGMPKRRLRLAPLDLVCALLAGLVSVPLFLLAVGPTVSWDADVYHLTLPRLFLEAHGFRSVPVLVYGHWPLATELLYAVAMALSSYVTAKLLHLVFGLLVLWTLAAAVRRATPMRTARAAGWLAVALVLANDVVAFELRVAYVELAQAFALLAAVLFLSSACDEEARGAANVAKLALAGLACGLMAAIKVTGILWLPVVAALYLPQLLAARGRRAVSFGRFAAAFGLPVAALWVPWLVKSWWYTGNPLYPFAWTSFGGPWWSAQLGEQLGRWQRGIGMGRGVSDYLRLPLRVILDGGAGYAHFDGRLSPLWLVALPLALAGAWRSPLARRALFVAAGCFALWAASAQQMRFLVPLLPLVALAAGVGSAAWIERLPSPSLRPVLAGALAVSALLAAAATHATVIGAGLRRWALYRAQPASALYAHAAPPVFAAIDRLPTAARVLMIGTNHGFFCHREYLADSFFEASQLADWLADTDDDQAALRARLATAGVSHVLVDRRATGIAWPRALASLLADRTRVEAVYADAQHRLYALSMNGAGHRP